MSISRKDICTRTYCPLGQANRLKQHTNTKTNQTRRPANPPARLAFRQRKSKANSKNQTQQKTGPEPKQNTHKIDLPWDAVACPLHHSQKRAKWINITAFGQTWRLELVCYLQACAMLYKKAGLQFKPLSASSQISSSEGLHGQSRQL